MATQDPKEILQLLDQIQRAWDRLGDTNPFRDFDVKKFTDVNDAVRILEAGLRDVNREIYEIGNDLDGIISSIGKTVDEINKQNSALGNSTKNLRGIQSIAQKLSYDYSEISKLSKKELENLQEKFKQQAKLLTQNRDDLKDEILKLQMEEADQKLIDKRVMALQAINNEINEEKSNLNFIGKQIGARIKQEERITELMGLGGAAVEGTKTALDKLGFGGLANALGLDKVQEKMREAAEEIEKSGGSTEEFADKFKVLKAGIDEAGKQFVKSLKDPAAVTTFLLKEMISALKSADKATGELAKSFGTSYSEASSLRNELNTIANLSGDININTASLQKSLVALNKSFGTAAMMSGEILKDFTRLTEVAGYSEEAALGLSRITIATGTDLSDNTSEILGQAAAFNATNKLALNEKEIVEGVAKASSATTLSLGMQPRELTKAVAQAKALGTELSKVEAIAGSLLQFESSISAELEAELLTGKQLNLERARTAALNNDIATVAEEIAKQIGSAEDFTNMNRIQQEALAKAVGMEREELAKSLIEREALAKIGVQDAAAAKEKFDKLVEQYGYERAIKELGDEKYGQQLASQSIQERFNKSVEKLREIFVSVAEPILQIINPFVDLATTILPLINIVLTPITGAIKFIGESVKFVVDGFNSLVNSVSNLLEPFISISEIINNIQEKWSNFKQENEVIFKIFGAIGEALKGFLGTFILLIGAVKVFKAIQKMSFLLDVGKMIVSGIGAAFKLPPPLGFFAGIAATAGMIALGAGLYNRFKGDDVVSPGYGKRTLMMEEGAIALNDKDTVIAGTDLMGGKGEKETTTTSSPSPSIDMSPVVDRLMAVESVLKQILAKEGNVYMDGNKVGKSLALANSNIGV